jgi:hypothetical protein
MYDAHRINQIHSIIFIHVQKLRSLWLLDFTKNLQGLNRYKWEVSPRQVRLL